MTLQRANAQARIGAMVAVFALLSACARSSLPSGKQGTVPSPGTSALPTAVGSGDPVVVATVRAYLEADARHDYHVMMLLADGNIHKLWQWWDWELGSCTCPTDTLTIGRLTVQKEDTEQATVDVFATLESTGINTITGPMTLVRDGAGWVVHDYRRNGIDLASNIASRSGHDESEGIHVSLLGVDRDKTSEDVWFRITNNTPHDISLDTFVASAGVLKLTPTVYNAGVKDILRDHWMVTNLVWLTPQEVPAGRPLVVRLTFVDLANGDHHHVSFSTLS